jgi:hypothetical protein
MATRWRCLGLRQLCSLIIVGCATYLRSVLVLNRSVRDQEKRVDAVKGMFQRSGIIVICFTDSRTRLSILVQLLGRAGDESKVLCWKAS